MKCDYHPWESGFVLLRDSPYMAKTDSDGEFTIENLPYGSHTLRIWHERVGYLKEISLGAGKTTRKGEFDVKINASETKLGRIKVSSKLFEND